jgi:O-acetyl-ADP-ribose deacetylase (regulator of RNase III)
MEIKEGNILTATEDYIVQQTCCTACRAHGLSEAIAAQFPHGNPYKIRKPVAPRKNFACLEDRGKPGTCLILGDGTPEKRWVACLMGQVAMGKPGVYDSVGLPDSREDRERYFQAALEDLASRIPEKSSLAFPWKIGCGLAGGNWCVYQKILETWCSRNPGFRVTLYQL